jgi:hypothetical protein
MSICCHNRTRWYHFTESRGTQLLKAESLAFIVLNVQDSFDIHPTLSTGSVTGTIVGNDQIPCGNVASTWYQVTPMITDCATPDRSNDGEPAEGFLVPRGIVGFPDRHEPQANNSRAPPASPCFKIEMICSCLWRVPFAALLLSWVDPKPKNRTKGK